MIEPDDELDPGPVPSDVDLQAAAVEAQDPPLVALARWLCADPGRRFVMRSAGHPAGPVEVELADRGGLRSARCHVPVSLLGPRLFAEAVRKLLDHVE